MIDDPLPIHWKDLQNGVQRIFRNVGLNAEVEVNVETPRGSVNVDVLAIDPRSVDKIRYIVECKNWCTSVPQTVVHSFTTVMHETGANIGFIISKHGFQDGAKRYTQSTNITGLTYLEFQQRYFEAWWKRYFCPLIGDAADKVHLYTEEFNHQRDRAYDDLTPQNKEKFDTLKRREGGSIMILSMFNYLSISKGLNTGTLLDVPKCLDDFKFNILSKITPHIQWHCDTFRDLLITILQYLADIKAEFESIFGTDIFERDYNISGVTIDGPSMENGIYQ
ncbi:Restriction endonuclease [Morganella morganii]|uniref:restriction endonuclease n=1 Tax=Morganella morganii TaxID=582 RepID=UPI000DA3DE37|nr:restriction endonuclease [Morganella morganii]SQL23906.1 Restriction endonuclease [Morganella morganii]